MARNKRKATPKALIELYRQLTGVEKHRFFSLLEDEPEEIYGFINEQGNREYVLNPLRGYRDEWDAEMESLACRLAKARARQQGKARRRKEITIELFKLLRQEKPTATKSKLYEETSKTTRLSERTVRSYLPKNSGNSD